MIGRIAAILALMFAAVLVPVGSAHADGIGHDAVIKNQKFSYTNLGICKDAISETKCGSTHGWLSPGQNSKSKYGWADTDGIFCGKGWWCKVAAVTFRGYGSGWNSRFIKVGGCFGCTIPVYVWKDRG